MASPSISFQGPPLERMSAQNKFDALSTIGSAILSIVALSLVINYAVHPISPMVPITSNLSLSLPMLICSSIGTVTTITFIVQMIRHKHIKLAFERYIGQRIISSNFLRGLIRRNLHLGGREEGESVENYQIANKELIERAEQNIGPCVSFQTRDGVTLRGYWNFVRKSVPTVIIFHGNTGTAESMTSLWGKGYKSLDNEGARNLLNILVMEYRGYGQSEGEKCSGNQEMEAYFDAEAALNFVLNQGVAKNRVVAHGVSLGGAYAAALAYFYGIKCVVLDHTFTSFGAVIQNVSPLSMNLAHHAAYAAYEQKEAPKHDTIPDAINLKTDGFNSLGKLA
jgi:hypothetical protein